MLSAFRRFMQRPTFIQSLIMPAAAMLLFSLFALLTVPDPARVAPSLSLGVVNEATDTNTGLGSQLVSMLDNALPLSVTSMPSEDVGRQALNEGEVSALLIIPGDLSEAIRTGAPAEIDVIVSQHLTPLESQFTANLPAQLQAMVNGAIGQMSGNPPAAPAVVVASEVLHAAPNPTAQFAPAIMLQSTWMAAFMGGLMLFLTTRGERGPSALAPVALFRSGVPLATTALSSLVMALVVAGTTGLWASFLAIWGVVWISALGITLLSIGLFSVLSFGAIGLLVPTVFFQGALAGAQAPISSLPDWLRWAAESAPFSAVVEGYRMVLIGGPESFSPYATLGLIAVVGAALVWLGTFLHTRRQEELVPRLA